jgi:hypothetical protein
MLKHIWGGAFALFALSAPEAHAVYVENYSDWKAITVEAQTSYLVGALDGWLQSSDKGEPVWVVARRKGLKTCLYEQKITAPMLLELVSKHYERFNADWRLPPAPVLFDVLQGMCLVDINRERKAVGLAPWDRKPPQISKDIP